MSRESENHPIDLVARAIHARAVERVPPRTLAQLQPRTAGRRSPGRPPAFGWALAAACAAVFAFAVGMYTLVDPEGSSGPAPGLAGAADGLSTPEPWEDPMMVFDEDPDLFVWLASDAQPVAME